MYSTEEFAQKLKLRGIVRYIDEARKYVKQTGKNSFDDSDFETAYHAFESQTIGRSLIKDNIDGEDVYYKRDKYGVYWRI